MNSPIPTCPLAPMKPERRRRLRRGHGDHWREHTFRAVFRGLSYAYDRRTSERTRLVELSDVYLDGSLLTLSWRVPEVPGLARLCRADGATIHFRAQFAQTGPAVRAAGQPLLRAPIRPLVVSRPGKVGAR